MFTNLDHTQMNVIKWLLRHNLVWLILPSPLLIENTGLIGTQ